MEEMVGQLMAEQKKIYTLKFSDLIFIAVVLVMGGIFFFKAIKAADKKNMWADEFVALSATVRDPHCHLLLRGGSGEGSPAPLDYLVLRGLDAIGSTVHYFGLSSNSYYRLSAIGSNLFIGAGVILFVFFFIRKKIQSGLFLALQSLCLIAALVIFYFWPFNFQYATEMRPYALWNSLWFASLAYFMCRGIRWPLKILLILLALTQTASIFQLCCFCLIYILGQWGLSVSFRDIFKNVLMTFVLPMAIALYYISCKHSDFNYGNHDVYMGQFWNFWTNKEKIPILTVTGICITIAIKNMRQSFIVFATMLLLYLVSPIINYIILAHNFFFSSRHYIYYDLIYPLFLIHFAINLEQYLSRKVL
ncbi:MAG: hypothetical protein HQL26_07580 [Candidatus Omnitrophica bacterium]|nr:hypothetical protein [Candidatus Omnitrophota bacterium]